MNRIAFYLLVIVPITANAQWKAKADPPAEAAKVPADLKIEIVTPKSFFDPDVTFAENGGHFVALGRNGGKGESRTFHDLATGKKIGELSNTAQVEKRTLSPDGKLFAGVVGGFGKSVLTVFDVAKGKMVADVPVKNGAEFVTFVSNDKFVYQGGFGDKNIHVFDAKSGTELATFVLGKGFRRCPPSFSPGGKYVAVAEGDEIAILSLSDGSEAGRVSVKGEAGRYFSCEWVSFSADGAFFAALAGASLEPRVQVWSMADGKRVADIALQKPGRFAFYDGPKLEWAPDGTGWLLNGSTMYDRESGKILWKVPEDGPGKKGVRRALAVNTVAYLDSKDRNHRLLKSHSIGSEKLAAIRTSLRGGGTAVDAVLPKLVEVDAATAKEAESALAGVAFTATIDVAPAGPGAARRPVPLPYKALQVDGVFIVAGDKPAAILDIAQRTSMFAQASDAESRRIETLSLVSGNVTNKLETPPGCKLVAISADGSHGITVDQPDNRRMDVWSLVTGKHVVGWRPYPKAAEKDRKLKYVGVHGDRVLTVSNAGQVVAWQLTDAKPIWKAILPGTLAATPSPGGKYLVIAQQGVVRFIDAATGQIKGDLEPKGVAMFQEHGPTAIAIRPDGQEVVALFRKDGGGSQTLARWDGKGKLLGESAVTIPAFGAPDMQFAGSGHVLIDGRQLYDLKRQALVWTYAMAGPGRMASRVSDGRTWYVVGTGFDGPATLIAAQLPEEQVEGYVKEVIDGPNAILKPGTHIGVRIDFVGSQAEAVKETARENVYRTLKEYGLVPGAAGDLSIELSVIQKDTGETIEFRKLFGGLGGDARGLLTVKEIELECKTVLSSGAEQLWAPPAQKMRMREIYGIIRLPDKDTNLTDYLYRQLWDRVPGFAAGVGVPRYLAKTANGVVALPGISLLQASGPLTQKPKR